jgi:hypothetical protein
MDIEQQSFILSTTILVATSSVYGRKFLGKGNYLLGAGWLVIAASGAGIVVYALGDLDGAYRVAYFCDAFSRGCGPLITILGLMAVTHGYRTLPCFDLYLFGAAIAGTAVLVDADAAAPLRPTFYLFMWSVLSFYLVYFIARLLGVRAYRHAFGVGVVLLSAQAVAGTYDFYPLPGDEGRLLFHTLAAPVWAFLCAELYHAYCALERATPELASEADYLDELDHLF